MWGVWVDPTRACCRGFCLVTCLPSGSKRASILFPVSAWPSFFRVPCGVEVNVIARTLILASWSGKSRDCAKSPASPGGRKEAPCPLRESEAMRQESTFLRSLQRQNKGAVCVAQQKHDAVITNNVHMLHVSKLLAVNQPSLLFFYWCCFVPFKLKKIYIYIFATTFSLWLLRV